MLVRALGLELPTMLLAGSDEVGERRRFMLHCMSPVMADFVAKVFLRRGSKILRAVTRLSCKDVGTSSPDEKIRGDLGNATEATQIGGRPSDRLMAGKLSPGNFGLLQHNRH